MKNLLLWKLFFVIVIGSVVLFWVVDLLTKHTEQSMSFISEAHQQEILAYGEEAESLYSLGDEQVLATWLSDLQKKEQTWAAVSQAQITPLANSVLSEQFLEGFRLGRNVTWKIHLYFQENPIMDVPFADGKTHFLIRLPQRMRPGSYFRYTDLALQIALPFIVLCFLTWVLYRHVMRPVEKLERATRQFRDGDFDVRVKEEQGERHDELANLGDTFNQMAEKTSHLISSQRQLLADLSHEVRTPLARMDMAVDFVEQGINPEKALARLRYESKAMRELVEDTLTLVWLDNEKPQLNQDDFDLVELITVICDDARFEYPDRRLNTDDMPSNALLIHSSQHALGQAFENIIRNALSHTPHESSVDISLSTTETSFEVHIKDYGPGVPEDSLGQIFKPFFQVDDSRLASFSRNSTIASESFDHDKKRGGYGLGLALAKRQIAAVGGSVKAENHFCDLTDSIENPRAKVKGLLIIVTLPRKA